MLRSAAMFIARCSRSSRLYLALAASWLGGACQPAAQSALTPPASAPARVEPGAAPETRPSDARARARALLQAMTPDEKAASLVHVFDWTYAKTADQLCHALPLGPGSFERIGLHRGPAETASVVNALRACMQERSRLHIPPLFLDEGVHGLMQQGATNFPVALALGASFNPALVQQVFEVVAREARARGTSWILGPNLDLAREPRWGRMDEMYGEDPYLVARLGVAAIVGLQGRQRPFDREHVLATTKHFAAHSQPEGGINGAPVSVTERTLRGEFFVPFEAAIGEAHVGAVMAAYHEIDGVPGHINRWLLDDVLRSQWGFDGLVVSDGMGVERLESVHHVTRSRAESARKALLAGIDYEIGATFLELPAEIAAGRVPQARLDEAVERALVARFELGLFDAPALDPAYAARVNNAPEHQKLALEAARQGAVLLANDGVLPLDRKRLRRIAVVGPNAAGAHLGGYSVDPGRAVSLLDGIRAAAGPGLEVRYARGCDITREDLTWQGFWKGKVELPEPAGQKKLIEEAVRTARGTDLVIVAIGENEATSRETWGGHPGDRDSLALLGAQNELVAELGKTGVPIVLVVIGARPLQIGPALSHARAAVAAFYLGQEGGTALAELLFGDVSPSGHLPITWPRSEGQLPAYYYKKPSAIGPYLFSDDKPQFPFGWGLSYTSFAHSEPRVTPTSIGPAGHAEVVLSVTNTGHRPGTDVVQLYVGARHSSVTRPVRLARGFERVALAPGESREVRFTLGPADLAYFGAAMRREVEPGTYVLEVGSSSAELAAVELEVQAP